MTDYYLKFPNESEANQIIFTEVATEWDDTDPENPIPTDFEQIPNYRNIDILGTLYNDDGQYDEEGNVITEPTPKEGWHINIRVLEGESIEPLLPYSIHPESPTRIWS